MLQGSHMAVAYSGSCKTFSYSSSCVKGKLSDAHTKKINVEVVNGDCLLTLEGIFYLLAVRSTNVCVLLERNVLWFLFFCSKFSSLLWDCSVFICTVAFFRWILAYISH